MSTLFGSPALSFMYMSASPPEAPPLSDTTIGCFMRLFFWMAACIMRAIWSEAPPAPAATTISTGFVGSQATDGVARKEAATAAAMAATDLFMGTPPVVSSYSSRKINKLTVSMRNIRIALVLAAAAAALPAPAILIRADRDDAEYREMASKYTSSVAIAIPG